MIHDKIKQIRLQKKITQHEMSRGLNICQNTYSLIENGKTKLDHERILSIAEFLGVSLQELLFGFQEYETLPFENHFESSKDRIIEDYVQLTNFLKEIIVYKDKQLESLIKQNEVLLDYFSLKRVESVSIKD